MENEIPGAKWRVRNAAAAVFDYTEEISAQTNRSRRPMFSIIWINTYAWFLSEGESKLFLTVISRTLSKEIFVKGESPLFAFTTFHEENRDFWKI